LNSFAFPLPAEAAVDATWPSLRAPGLPRIFVVPAFNEAQNLPRLLEDFERRVELLTPGSRLIVVDDGSEDGTAQLAAAHEGRVPVQVIELGTNQGPGAAFRAGFGAALDGCGEEAYIVTLEADTTSDLDALPSMIDRAAGGAEVVLASVHRGGQMLNVSRMRRVLSVLAGKVVRVALGLDAHTVSSFYRVYRASTLRRALDHYGDGLIEERGFACKAELLAKLARLGATIEEVPIDLDGSLRVGESKMSVLPTLMGYARLMARQRTGKEPTRS
jgi:dolichol-phosphate mannosyltransferase